MKRFNYRIIVFICVAALMVGGLFSRNLLAGCKNALVNFIKSHSISTFISQVDTASEEISYKGSLVDLYSLYFRLMDVRSVEKGDRYVVRMENGYLCMTENSVDASVMDKMADSCANLRDVAESVNAEFLYVMAPRKLYYEETADGCYNITQQKYHDYLADLKQRNIQVLDLAEKMEQQNIRFEDAFFITDHHWKPETGFWAAGQIMEHLNRNQEFPYNAAITDLNNYDVKVYEDWFLGATGKKVGRFFSPLGVDDISLITPKFDTSLTVTDTRGTRTGSLQDTLINMSQLREKNYHNKNPYAAYSGGDFGLQVIQNENAAEDAKNIVIIRDSFACCVTPYLSMATDTLHVMDVRYWRGTDTAKTMVDYIKEVKPDYVLVLYSSVDPEMTNF